MSDAVHQKLVESLPTKLPLSGIQLKIVIVQTHELLNKRDNNIKCDAMISSKMIVSFQTFKQKTHKYSHTRSQKILLNVTQRRYWYFK